MDDQRLGSVFRAVRIRKRLRQSDVAARAEVSRGTVSRLERGHFETLSLRAVRRMARELEIAVVLPATWRGGDLDRLMNAGHAAMHEATATVFDALPEWELAPEVSFSIYGERGVIDDLAFHRESGIGLVIELKTEIVDPQELVGSVDRKRRLARAIGAERGWVINHVGVWVLVADSRSNRARLARLAHFFRRAFPADGHHIRRWLRYPSGPVAALSFLHHERSGSVIRRFGLPKRIYLDRPRSRGDPESRKPNLK